MNPIWIDCEGSGCPPNVEINGAGMCTMCGTFGPLDGTVIARHQRQDVLAMIDRGDFG